MKCPKCGKLLDFSHEKIYKTDLINMITTTTCNYFCRSCQRTFFGINSFELHWLDTTLIPSEKENI